MAERYEKIGNKMHFENYYVEQTQLDGGGYKIFLMEI